MATSDLPVLSGLVLDLDANKLALSDNDAVATWADESGLGNDATQATAGSRPTYKTNILNGNPVVRFDGTDDYLSVGNATAIVDFTGGHVVVVATVTSLQDSFILAHFTPDTNDRFYINITSAGKVLTGLGNKIGAESVSTITAGNSYVFEMAWDGSNVKLYIDGVEEASDAYTHDPAASSGLDLGRASNSGDRYIHADIAQIAIYDQILTTQEREDVKDYLTTTWLTPTPETPTGLIVGLTTANSITWGWDG